MSAKNILLKTYDHVAEYAEMLDNPSALVAEVLAHKVFSLEGKIEYLNKRLDHVQHANFNRS